ncbi:MAG: hypothetical protein AAGB48_06345 [Planctomycetota bacterium]
MRPIGSTLFVMLALTLAGCAAKGGSPTPAQQKTAGPTDTPVPQAQPRVESSTPLVEPTPQVTPVEAPPGEWAPDWFRPGPSRFEGRASASAVATADNLLDARRDAVDRANDLLGSADSTSVERTVTRQLDGGEFRVWVRIVAEQG